MTLPAVEPLSSLPHDAWRMLGRRLRHIGVDEPTSAPYRAIAAKDVRWLGSPLVKWHLRRDTRLAACAMRMLMFWDPVTPPVARAVLGDELPLEKMIEIGLLRLTGAGDVVSPFVMSVVSCGRPTYLLHDDVEQRGDAVMGPSSVTTTLARLACPQVPVDRGLDVGCGPGTLALALAQTCGRVVATDVNPRAIALAQINAWMSEVENVELRTGDLFAPVAGESFDVIASQPPFVAHPPELASSAFLYGGARGDELPMRLLQGVARYLAPGGLALFGVTWPLVHDERPLLPRLREQLGLSGDLTLLVLHGSASDPELECISYGGRLDDEARERNVLVYREHFEREKIHRLVLTFTAVRRQPGTSGWTSTVPLEKIADAPASRAALDALFAEGDRTARAAPAVDEWFQFGARRS